MKKKPKRMAAGLKKGLEQAARTELQIMAYLQAKRDIVSVLDDRINVLISLIETNLKPHFKSKRKAELDTLENLRSYIRNYILADREKFK